MDGRRSPTRSSRRCDAGYRAPRRKHRSRARARRARRGCRSGAALGVDVSAAHPHERTVLRLAGPHDRAILKIVFGDQLPRVAAVPRVDVDDGHRPAQHPPVSVRPPVIPAQKIFSSVVASERPLTVRGCLPGCLQALPSLHVHPPSAVIVCRGNVGMPRLAASLAFSNAALIAAPAAPAAPFRSPVGRALHE